MGCLFSCFRDIRVDENLELSKSLINDHRQTDDRDFNNYDFDYYPDFFETIYRRRLYTSD